MRKITSKKNNLKNLLHTKEKFLYSDESSSLTLDEFSNIEKIITQIEELIIWRTKLFHEGILDKKTAFPSGNWDPNKKQVSEITEETSSFMNSFELIMSKDFDIIKKLRLYSQAFSGYQLATLCPAVRRPWIKDKLADNYDVFLKMLVTTPDDSVNKFLSIVNKLPESYRFSFPKKFGEIGWIIDDMILNKDSYMYLERICLLHESGTLSKLIELSKIRPITIMEVGSGFGGLAYFLKKILPNSKIILIDIPESLVFSYIYLATLFPKEEHCLMNMFNQTFSNNIGFTYVANYNISTLMFKDIDLAINTLSFAEMETTQVLEYCELIKQSLTEEGVLFEQNFNSSPNAPKDLFSIIQSVLKNPKEIQSKIISNLEKGIPHIWSV
jgi:putative sugar O-methyltransferase